MPFGYSRNPRKHGRARRNSRVGKILRRRLHGSNSRRTVAKARRVSRILGKYAKSSAGLRRSTTTRTGRPPLPRGFFKHGRRGRVSTLNRKSTGPINSSYRYRASYRRKFHISRRKQRSVALATGHTIQNTAVLNGFWNGANGVATWNVIDLGVQADTIAIANNVIANAAGFDVPDPNTVPGSSDQYLMNTKVLNHSINYFCINSSTTKITVTCYPLIPRLDITTGREPLSCMALGRTGELLFTGGTSMPFNDPRFTPYMCPTLREQYKIMKPKVFTVHGGGKFNLNARHSYDLKQYTDNENPVSHGRKPIYRPVLVKIVGEIGVVEAGDPPVRYIRNVPTSVIWKRNTFYAAHLSRERRLIYTDDSISSNQSIAGITGTTFINQETDTLATRAQLDPITVS